MSKCGRELVAPDESTILTKPLLGAMVVENCQSDGCLPDSSRTDESNWGQVFSEADDPLDQFVASEAGPRCRGRRFTRWAGWMCRRLYSLVTQISDTI